MKKHRFFLFLPNLRPVALSLKEQTLPSTEQIPVANHDWPVDVLIVGDSGCFVRHH